MRSHVIVCTAALLFNALVPVRGESVDLIQFNFAAADTGQMLEMYAVGSGLKLIKSSQIARLNSKITIQPTDRVLRSEMVRLIEKALVEQAGIVITRLDERTASVSYNDALPVTPVLDVKPIPNDGQRRYDPPVTPGRPASIPK